MWRGDYQSPDRLLLRAGIPEFGACWTSYPNRHTITGGFTDSWWTISLSPSTASNPSRLAFVATEPDDNLHHCPELRAQRSTFAIAASGETHDHDQHPAPPPASAPSPSRSSATGSAGHRKLDPARRQASSNTGFGNVGGNIRCGTLRQPQGLRLAQRRRVGIGCGEWATPSRVSTTRARWTSGRRPSAPASQTSAGLLRATPAHV